MMLTPDNFAAYDALPIGVVMLREDLVIDGWNAAVANWSGVAASDAVGKNLQGLFPELDAKSLRLRMRKVIEYGQSVVLSDEMEHQVLPLHTSNGRPLLHRIVISSAPDDPRRVLLVIEDITTSIDQLTELREERQRLQASERSLRVYGEELHKSNAALVEARRNAEDANAAKSQFVANMSHEIRTPLTAVKGFAEILLDHSESDFARDAAERVVRNGELLIAIVNDVLDLSKIESGSLTLKCETGSPQKIVEDVRRTFSQHADKKGIELSVHIADDAPDAYLADSTRLFQILNNLIGNALKFTEAGAVRVQVDGVRETDGHRMVRFEVSDTGVGIDPAKLETIFEPFTQADTSTQRRYGGTGLGLAICQKLTDQMGGSLTVASEPGVGSTFTLLMPAGEAASRQDAAAHPDSADNKASDTPLSLSGRRILVAEDGPDNQRLIEYLLLKAGAELLFVENGQLAIEAILGQEKDSAFDAVILDMQMPVMDGYTAALKLRDAGVTLPIIALTANAMMGDRDKALEAGCSDYLTKPIEPSQLIGLLQKLIGTESEALSVANA